MDRVLDRLWIGSTHDLDGATPLQALGFRAVVDLRDDAPDEPVFPIGFVHRNQRRDGDAWTAGEAAEILSFIHKHVVDGRVLVACGAGMSRSASVVIAYLVRCGWDIAEAYAAVERARPAVAPKATMLAAMLGTPAPAPASVDITPASRGCKLTQQSFRSEDPIDCAFCCLPRGAHPSAAANGRGVQP